MTPEIGEHLDKARGCLAKTEPRLREFSRFLSQSYNLKDIADYELGPGAAVPLDRASAAIATAERFVERIAEILA
ncbi:MAG TPA: hypothetical protein VE993_09675 [Stellaceae bacterium]|nr:hypothetical protein [Stellaceae bacterium]